MVAARDAGYARGSRAAARKWECGHHPYTVTMAAAAGTAGTGVGVDGGEAGVEAVRDRIAYDHALLSLHCTALLYRSGAITPAQRAALKDLIVASDGRIMAACALYESDRDVEELLDTLRHVAALEAPASAGAGAGVDGGSAAAAAAAGGAGAGVAAGGGDGSGRVAAAARGVAVRGGVPSGSSPALEARTAPRTGAAAAAGSDGAPSPAKALSPATAAAAAVAPAAVSPPLAPGALV